MNKEPVALPPQSLFDQAPQPFGAGPPDPLICDASPCAGARWISPPSA
jgi:hypothetical protein